MERTTTTDLLKRFTLYGTADLSASEGRLYTTRKNGHTEFWNYATLIAIVKGSKVYLNVEKYSLTTSKHQNKIRRFAGEYIEMTENELVELSNQ